MTNSKAVFSLILLLCLAIAIIFSILGLWVCTAYKSPISNEVMHVPYFAQVARNVSRGEGFTTDIVFPATLYKFGAISNQPDLFHPPLYTLVLALFMAALSASDWTLVTCSFFFYLIAIVVFFILAYRIFDIKVASLSCFFLMINSKLLNSAVLGAEDTFVLILFTLLILCLYLREPQTVRGDCVPGVLLGLLYLARYTSILFVPAVCWHIYRTSPADKRKHVLFCAGSFVVVISPWLIRNLIVTGNPFFTYAWITDLHGSGIGNLLTAKGVWTYGQIGGLSGLVTRFAEQIKEWFLITGDLLSLLFLIAIPHRFENERLEKIRHLMYVLILIIIGQQIIYSHPAPYILFYPFVIMISVAFFFHLIHKVSAFGKREEIIAVALLIVINMPPFLSFYGQLSKMQGTNAFGYWRFPLAKVGQEKVLVSDSVHIISWFKDRKVVMLPSNIEEWNTMVDDIKGKPAILFSPLMEYPAAIPDIPWYQIKDKASEGMIDKQLGLNNGFVWKTEAWGDFVVLY